MTNSAQFSQITDELLSAYLDQAVTAAEKNLIEAAVAADPTIAWRLDTLRQTVQLLRALPPVALPRSFVLTEGQLNPTPKLVAARTVRPLPQPVYPTPAPAGWQALLTWWRSFWQMGSPVLRNAMAASFVVLFVLLAGEEFFTPQPFTARSADLPAVRVAEAQTMVPTVATAPDTALVDTQATASPAEPAPQSRSAELPEVTSGSSNGAEAIARQASAPPPVTPTASAGALHDQQTFANKGGPGEDQGVDLAPGGADEGVAAAGVGGGAAESTLTDGAVADRVVPKQADPSSNRAAINTALASPLELPAVAMAAGVSASITQSTPITVTTALTQTVAPAAEATATPGATPGLVVVPTTVVNSTTTQYDPSEVALVIAPPPSPLVVPAEPPPAGSGTTARLHLLQAISGLVTLVLAGLWWRSRARGG